MADSEFIDRELNNILSQFDEYKYNEKLRNKILALAEMLQSITNLGVVNVDPKFANNNHDRLLAYFQMHVGQVLTREELFIVSAGWECTKRTRELRFKFGWPIISKDTIKQMIEEGDLPMEMLSSLKPSSYMMLENRQDKEAAFRYHTINTKIKKNKSLSSDKKRLLAFFKNFVNIPLNGEELHDVAGTKEWARRIRELRTEEGWPIMTNKSGRPDLPQGYYILVEDKQEEEHDRIIPVEEKIKALDRDNNRCRKCGWSPVENPNDPLRFQLELHHIKHHVNYGDNTSDNLITLCNVHHDVIHKLDNKNLWPKSKVLLWLVE